MHAVWKGSGLNPFSCNAGQQTFPFSLSNGAEFGRTELAGLLTAEPTTKCQTDCSLNCQISLPAPRSRCWGCQCLPSRSAQRPAARCVLLTSFSARTGRANSAIAQF